MPSERSPGLPEGWVDAVHRYWFAELRPEAWFRADPAVDAAIVRRFIGLHDRLRHGVPPGVAGAPRSCVAAVIVLDQFSRNMFRGTAQAYAQDALALRTAEDAIAGGLDRQLAKRERQFLYMPFNHSEDRAVQRRSVTLFAALDMPEAMEFVLHHADVVERFGRFPHRNEILGRTTTAEEAAFIATDAFSQTAGVRRR